MVDLLPHFGDPLALHQNFARRNDLAACNVEQSRRVQDYRLRLGLGLERARQEKTED